MTSTEKKRLEQHGFRLQPTFWLPFEVANPQIPEEVTLTTEQGSSMMYVAGDSSHKLKWGAADCIQGQKKTPARTIKYWNRYSREAVASQDSSRQNPK